MLFRSAKNHRIYLIGMAVVGVVIAIYLLGLPGGFLLDDSVNLRGLVRLAEEKNLAALGAFLFANPSGDLGRIIPMLSFALQAQAWPGSPESFKFVNILLHGLNAGLFYLLVERLLRRQRDFGDFGRQVVAGGAALIWALHPLNVSTVLYVVQRMTEMSAFFMLIGLLLYVVGRQVREDGGRHGLPLMVLGVVGGCIFGAACKENALLLPLVVISIEFTVFSNFQRSKEWYFWFISVVLFPLFLVFGYIAWNFSIWILPGYEIRNFSLAERLMTECRVIWTYLGNFIFPVPSSLGLYHDDYPISRAWLLPMTTLPAALALMASLLIAVFTRKRFPGFALAILWYLGSQCLESGAIPLELYFEHRNYFPMLGLLLGLAWELASFIKNKKYRWGSVDARWPLGTFLIGWFSLLLAVLLVELKTWANPDVLSEVWANEHPSSIRAQSYFAARLVNGGFIDAAISRYEELQKVEPGFALLLAGIDCRMGKIYPREETFATLERLNSIHFSRVPLGGIEQFVDFAEVGRCMPMASQLIDVAAPALLENAAFSSRHFHVHVLRGRLRFSQRRFAEADVDFLAALQLRSDVEVALLRVKTAFFSGNTPRAMRLLQEAEQINSTKKISRHTYALDIENWRNLLNKNSTSELNGN